ncbi:Yip1 family protein [Fusibacter sp. 3D3]|uniref:Yip1 family protein n=1 Tax=Fusibacter sp. 3D3 TaxID=1048380 RepID=UPI000853C22A|nr:Yip1 family protein [Fusibacter sp. 3D3]GAU76192.1 hypothetical protein F3D3_0789 [Fusibacter sp. 3D3]
MSEFKDREKEELIIDNQPSFQPEMGQFQRIIGIFTKPQEVILDINRSPKILIPMILVIVFTAAITYMSYDFLVEFQRVALVNAYKAQGLPIPLDGLKGMSENIAKGTVLLSGVGVVVGTFIMALITHGISTFFSGEGSIKKIFSASLYIYFIPLVGSAIAGLIAMALSLDVLTFSPAVLLDINQLGKPLYTLLTAFDIFNIWKLAIMIMAVKSIEALSTKKATIIIMSITVIGLLFQIVPNLGK